MNQGIYTRAVFKTELAGSDIDDVRRLVIELGLSEKIVVHLERATLVTIILAAVISDAFELIIVPFALRLGWTKPVADEAPPPTVLVGRGKSSAPPADDLQPDLDLHATD